MVIVNNEIQTYLRKCSKLTHKTAERRQLMSFFFLHMSQWTDSSY